VLVGLIGVRKMFVNGLFYSTDYRQRRGYMFLLGHSAHLSIHHHRRRRRRNRRHHHHQFIAKNKNFKFKLEA